MLSYILNERIPVLCNFILVFNIFILVETLHHWSKLDLNELQFV